MDSLTGGAGFSVAGSAGDMNFGGSSPAAMTVADIPGKDVSDTGLAGNIAVLNARLVVVESKISTLLPLANVVAEMQGAFTNVQSAVTNHAATFANINDFAQNVAKAVNETRAIVADVASKVSAGSGTNSWHDRIAWLENIIESATGKTSPHRSGDPAPAPAPAPIVPTIATQATVPFVPANAMVALPGADLEFKPILLPGSISGGIGTV